MYLCDYSLCDESHAHRTAEGAQKCDLRLEALLKREDDAAANLLAKHYPLYDWEKILPDELYEALQHDREQPPF